MPEAASLPATGFVPVPAACFDVLMPALTDTEWRILCVVLRQTLGWVDRENLTGRKERDWITQSQFQHRTGKSRDALSRGVQGLVAKGLLLVENEVGEPMETPRKRQRARERLYYRLGALLEGRDS